MKKLMTLMLGLVLVTGTVAISSAQDTMTKKSKTKKKNNKKKGGDTSKSFYR